MLPSGNLGTPAIIYYHLATLSHCTNSDTRAKSWKFSVEKCVPTNRKVNLPRRKREREKDTKV